MKHNYFTGQPDGDFVTCYEDLMYLLKLRITKNPAG